MTSINSRFAIGAGFALTAIGANAASLDFTVPSGGFSAQSYTAVGGTNPSAALTGGQITGEAGFQSIVLDVDGDNLDISIDDVLGGNPYFDANDAGREGGLGSCSNLTALAQCDPNTDDNLTISQNESIRFDFTTDAGATTSALFGNFVFRDDNHYLITGTVQVEHDSGSSIIAVTAGLADFSIIGSSEYLIFNSDGGVGSTSNYYISEANISAVPVPAAVWLFGSALGALGWVRRRKAA